MREHGPRVQRALIAAYGAEIGVEAHAEAMAVGWERWDQVAAMENPAGYLYRVGQSRARPGIRVLMVKAWGFTYAESAEVLGISEAALTNHVRRGMAALRRQLGVRR